MTRLVLGFALLGAASLALLVVAELRAERNVEDMAEFCNAIRVGDAISLAVERSYAKGISALPHKDTEGYLFRSKRSASVFPAIAFCDVRTSAGSVTSKNFFRD